MSRRLKSVVLFSVAVLLTLIALDKLTKTNKFQLIGEYVSRVETDRKVVAITFDDGPRADSTMALLSILSELNVKASFFLVGRQIEKHPELVKKIVLAGHQIGNHSYTHKRMISERPDFFRAEIERTDELIRSSGYIGDISFRAPFGRKFVVLPYLLNEYGKVDVLWDVDPRDYEADNSASVVSYVLESVRPGSIVLLHDLPNTVASLKVLVDGLRGRGYELVTVDELMKLKER